MSFGENVISNSTLDDDGEIEFSPCYTNLENVKTETIIEEVIEDDNGSYYSDFENVSTITQASQNEKDKDTPDIINEEDIKQYEELIIVKIESSDECALVDNEEFCKEQGYEVYISSEEESSSEDETEDGKIQGKYRKRKVNITPALLKEGLIRHRNMVLFRKKLQKVIRKKLRNSESYRSIARELGISASTLKLRLDNTSKQAKHGLVRRDTTLISFDLEVQLAAIVQDMDVRFHGLLMRDLKYISYEFAQKHLVANKFRTQYGHRSILSWCYRFCNRHDIYIDRAERMRQGFTQQHVTKFFETLQALYGEYKYLPQNVYSMDEIVLPLPKILHPPDLTQPRCHNRDHLTIMTCISAGGCYIPPATIFRKSIFTPAADQTPLDVLELVSDCGVMTNDLFVQWLKFFHEHVQPNEENPVLLLIDRHPAHRSYEALNFCTENSIHLVVIPSDIVDNEASKLVELKKLSDSIVKVMWYPVNKLQPLEEGYFKDLRTDFWESYIGLVRGSPKEELSERQLVDVFKKAHNKSFCAEKVREGFRKAGILPVCAGVLSAEDIETGCDL